MYVYLITILLRYRSGFDMRDVQFILPGIELIVQLQYM